MKERLDKREYYLNIAKAVAQRSSCIRRWYGAVAVINDAIVATGYNGSTRGENNCCDIKKCVRNEQDVPRGDRYDLCFALHAEENLCLEAGRRGLYGATVYLYGEDPNNGKELLDCKPCYLCMRKLKQCGVTKVVVHKHSKKRGTVEAKVYEIKTIRNMFGKHEAD